MIKYKARLNMHGGKQNYGMNYYKTTRQYLCDMLFLIIIFS